MEKRLAGRVAIVTGGGHGIGKAYAQRLAEEGAEVAIAEIDGAAAERLAADLERAGHGALGLRTDVAERSSVEAMAQRTLERFGRIDILVNNAGTYGPIGPLQECDTEEWRRAIEVNLLGTVYTSRAVLPSFRDQRSGRIVNLAGAGIGGPSITPRITAYAASKAAVVQFTESLAKEVSAWGVQVNAIAPGAVSTEITDAVIAAGPERAGRELYERNVRQKEQGGDPPELAARLAVYLASDACNLSGKLLSAKWDKVDAIDAEQANRGSLFALRRIDNVLFAEVKKP
jgi:3-oxoacyl-[acyl-carrier protein] reductase